MRSAFRKQLLPIGALLLGWASMGVDSCGGPITPGCPIVPDLPETFAAGAYAFSSPSTLEVIASSSESIFDLRLEGALVSEGVPSDTPLDGGCAGSALRIFQLGQDGGWLAAQAELTVFDGGSAPGQVFAAELSLILITLPDGGSSNLPPLSLAAIVQALP